MAKIKCFCGTIVTNDGKIILYRKDKEEGQIYHDVKYLCPKHWERTKNLFENTEEWIR